VGARTWTNCQTPELFGTRELGFYITSHPLTEFEDV
jgi:hypothetical protein